MAPQPQRILRMLTPSVCRLDMALVASLPKPLRVLALRVTIHWRRKVRPAGLRWTTFGCTFSVPYSKDNYTIVLTMVIILRIRPHQPWPISSSPSIPAPISYHIVRATVLSSKFDMSTCMMLMNDSRTPKFPIALPAAPVLEDKGLLWSSLRDPSGKGLSEPLRYLRVRLFDIQRQAAI